MATYGYIYDTPWFKEWIGSNPFDHVLKPLMKASNQTNLWIHLYVKQKGFCGVSILLLSPSVRPARIVVYGSTHSDRFDKVVVIFKGTYWSISFHDFHMQN